MKIKVLGSAAGGGFPQWNCNCSNCQAVRAKKPGYTARTQSSIAISDGSANWILVNASPDILTQIKNTPELQPNRSPRDSGIAAVILMDAQIDHTTGLLMMREGKNPMRLYTTPAVWEDLTNGLPLVPTLGFYCGVKWTPLCTECDEPFSISPLDSIRIKSIPLVSKAPPYSPSRYAQRRGDNIGLLIEDLNTGKTVFYAPGLGEITPDILPYMQQADVLMDVREADEFSAGHLPGAVLVPRGLLEFKLSATPALSSRDLKVVVYCKTSGRAALAAQAMQSMGYLNVTSIAGGYDAWAAAGKPVVKPESPSFE